MIALTRAFRAVLGAPVIHSVDPRIFTYRYFTHCMQCGFCQDQCCSYGVDIDCVTMERLRTLGAKFEAFIGKPEAEWFTDELEHDPEFPSGVHARTRVIDGKCVFAEPKGRGCRIHAWCLRNGLDYHLYKPLVSTLFPVTFEHGVLVPSPEVVDGTLVCVGDGPSLYNGVRDELGYYFGAGFVAELDGLGLSHSSR